MNAMLEERNGSLWFSVSVVLCKTLVLVCVLLHGSAAFVYAGAMEVLPLWLCASGVLLGGKSGGDKGASTAAAAMQGYEEAEYLPLAIGLGVAMAQCVSLVTHALVFSPLAARYETYTKFEIFTFVGAGSVAVLPMLPAGLSLALSAPLFVLLWATFSVCCRWVSICCDVLLRNGSYTHQQAMVCKITRAFTTIASVTACMVFAPVFAASARQSPPNRWPINQGLSWYLLGLVCMAMLALSRMLPGSIERRRREPKFLDYDNSLSLFDPELDSPGGVGDGGDGGGDGVGGSGRSGSGGSGGPDRGDIDIMNRNSLGNRTYKLVSVLEMEERRKSEAAGMGAQNA